MSYLVYLPLPSLEYTHQAQFLAWLVDGQIQVRRAGRRRGVVGVKVIILREGWWMSG